MGFRNRLLLVAAVGMIVILSMAFFGSLLLWSLPDVTSTRNCVKEIPGCFHMLGERAWFEISAAILISLISWGISIRRIDRRGWWVWLLISLSAVGAAIAAMALHAP